MASKSKLNECLVNLFLPTTAGGYVRHSHHILRLIASWRQISAQCQPCIYALLIYLVKKYVSFETKLKVFAMQSSDAIQVAERVIAEAEAYGFNNTAEAMRQVLKEMELIECAPHATFPAVDLLV